MITIENADKALKDYYLEAVSAQLNDGISPFFSAIEKSANNVFGKDVKIAVVRGASGNILAGAEDGDLPDPYRNRYLSITAPLKNLYGTIEISDKAMRASRDSSGAFVNLVNAEMEGLIASAKQNFQRMLFGDGTGKMCTVVSKSADKVYKVDKVKEYFVGMLVDVYPDTAGTKNDSYGLIITAVDKAASTVTFNASVSDDLTGGIMYPHGSKDNEICGLGAIFDSDELYGYKKSEEPYFKPYEVNAGGKLTEELLTDTLDYLEENFNSNANMIICSYKTRKKIAALIADNRRVVNTTDARTGFGVVTVNDVPVYADKYCPDDRILFVNTDDFSLNQLCDWEWLEDESGKILKQVQGKAAYGATLVKYAELICKKPCAQAKLYNI
ncbi:MAG: phage major capsid protein [Clostridia bacterium]|nr:phage major capsid protein [Clostridia bacterium]